MQQNDITISIIDKSEISVLSEYYKDYFDEITPDEALDIEEYRKVLSVMYDNKNRIFFWAFANFEKCGFAIVIFDKNIPDLTKIKARICEFYIFKKYRKQKIGTNFIKKIFDFLKSKGAFEINIEVHFENKPGFKFWKSLGFNIKKYMMKKMI